MKLKSLLKRRPSKPSKSTDERPMTSISHVTSGNSNVQSTDNQAVVSTVTSQESQDYEIFLENARKEEERKKKAFERLVKEAERKRKNCNMDPWVNKW